MTLRALIGGFALLLMTAAACDSDDGDKTSDSGDVAGCDTMCPGTSGTATTTSAESGTTCDGACGCDPCPGDTCEPLGTCECLDSCPAGYAPAPTEMNLICQSDGIACEYGCCIPNETDPTSGGSTGTG